MVAGRRRHVEHVMGTAVSFDIRSPLAPAALPEAIAFLHWVDATFSTYRHDSQINRLAAGQLREDDCERVVRGILRRCEELCEATDGWFDHRPVVAGRRCLDPSALVKGWSIDRCADMLCDEGATSMSINAGGDIRTVGTPMSADAWRVGIRHPTFPDRIAAVVLVADGAVATSGTYERGSHIWQTSTEPKLASVTLVGPELGTADALATSLFACGEPSPRWRDQFPDYKVLVVDHAGLVHHDEHLAVDRTLMEATSR
jgi:thiamine biosynthesis lipoprotein